MDVLRRVRAVGAEAREVTGGDQRRAASTGVGAIREVGVELAERLPERRRDARGGDRRRPHAEAELVALRDIHVCKPASVIAGNYSVSIFVNTGLRSM